MPPAESAPLVAGSPYAVTKLTGEHYARVFHELHGLETVCLRYFNVFGPRQRPDSQYAAVIPLFIDALLTGRTPQVHGDGLQSRDFTFIADTVQANLCAGSAPAERCAGKAFNIARGEPSSLLDLLDVLAGQLGVALLAIIIAGLALLVLMIPATALRSAFGRWLWHVDRRLVAVETYQKMGRLAALARLGPEASQTPTEYAAALGAVMPERSGELAIITSAYVKARFDRGGPPGLFEEAEILKARYQVYSALLERVGFVRRFFRRR